MPASSDSLQRDLVAFLKAQGFDAVASLPLSEAGDPRYAEWIEREWHGGLSYLEQHAPLKADPATAFSEYQSLMVVVREYGASLPPDPDPGVGNISRYALGDDYHRTMKRQLFAAADRMRERYPETAARAFVDTGPLNEKLIAARAGLGWQGKHTNLIDPRRGSWFFLGLLLVDAVLPEQLAEPLPDRCGLCDACIPACPTGAIVAPYQLDARRCISYLTIEQRGSIPRELREPIGHRIFGCDDCQEVCPWNRFAKADPPPEFVAREGARTTRIAEWLGLDIEEWRRRFRHSAVKRAGFTGFLRNCLVAAGNAADPELVAVVAPFLKHEEALLREHAAWALGRLGTSEARDELAAARTTETDATVRRELGLALED